MDQKGPRTKSLHHVRRLLEEVHRNYPEDASEHLRAEYFSRGMKRGLQLHEECGLTHQQYLEKISTATGISGAQIEHWISNRSRVNADFHLHALETQVVLVDDHIQACEQVLKRIQLHLDADDWRNELGAFAYLKGIGFEALQRYGGSVALELATLLGNTVANDELTLETKRYALNQLVRGLKSVIGRPEEKNGETEETEGSDEYTPCGEWVN